MHASILVLLEKLLNQVDKLLEALLIDDMAGMLKTHNLDIRLLRGLLSFLELSWQSYVMMR